MVSVSFEKTTLSNGLDVILHEDHTIPLVAVNVWYHVGSKDEEMGRTGFAHLFEHVMFEGSKHHNQSHFEPLQKAGANLNGSTTADRTNYWEDVPTNYLELALWLEADRMGFLLDALDQQRFDIQRDVVKNERRQSYENRPYGMAHWSIQEALFPLPHPYHW
ncbi:MAG: insulinase family protein, partial [Chloroflexi bacterium]|nr:insulinase family protein [Chloroflexota bacterium]